jgi:hypothetical protein
VTTIGDWLDARTPAPPRELAERVRAALGDAVHRPARDADVYCLDAAERLLEQIVGRDVERDRETAYDLLCVDALVTYAFEAAADEPASLGGKAVASISRLGDVGRAEQRA